MLKNLLDLMTQSRQGNKSTRTLRYDGQQQITDANDLIHAGYVEEMKDLLDEVTPHNADSLQGQIMAMAGTTLRTGYLAADPQVSFEPGKLAGSQVSYIINDPTFTLTTPNATTAVNYGDLGKIELWRNYYNASQQLVSEKLDEIDLAARFQESNRETAQTGLPANSTLGKITLTSIAKYNIKKWQKLNFFVTLAAADFKDGFNEIILKHTGLASGDQVSAAYKVFYDLSATTPTITGLDVALQTVSPKWLSGVKYAGVGSTVLVDAVGNALLDNTYVQDPITLTGLSGAPTVTIAPADPAVSGVSPTPTRGETINVNDKVVTLNVAGQATLDARVTATPKDPHGSYAASNSPSHNILVNTLAADDTGQTITFNSEKQRLPLNWNVSTLPVGTVNFDSTASIVGTQELEVGITANNECGLRYPNRKYSTYLPEGNPDYSKEGGDKKALFFLVAPTSKTDVVITLEGLAAGFGSDLICEIKLGNNQTGWLRTDLPFDSAAGVMTDGLGCLVGAATVSGSNTTFKASFGGKNTFAAGGIIFIRFTLKAGTSRVVNKLLTNL